MSDLHKLTISAPDGVGHSATVTLDGQQIYPTAVTLRACARSNLIGATVEFDLVAVEFDGMADVVARLTRQDAGPPPAAEGSLSGGPVPLQAANPAKETT